MEGAFGGPGSLAVTLNKCAMQIAFFRPVLSVWSFSLEKVGNPFCELFRTRAWPSRFHTKQGIFEAKIGVESSCPTSKRIDSKRFPTSCSDCDAWPQRDLRVASCVILSCLPCGFFCLRSEGRILRVRCRCSRIGTSSNWENARNRWHQDLAQSEKPQSFPSLKAEAKQKGCLLSLFQINVTSEIFPFETRIDFMTSCPRDWIKQLLGSNGNGHTRIHQAFGIHDWTWTFQAATAVKWTPTTWRLPFVSQIYNTSIKIHKLESTVHLMWFSMLLQPSTQANLLLRRLRCGSASDRTSLVQMLGSANNSWNILGPHFVAAATCRQDSASNTRWASGSADGGQYKQWPQVEEEVVNLEGENLDKCHMESNNFSFSKISHEDLRITITHSFS